MLDERQSSYSDTTVNQLAGSFAIDRTLPQSKCYIYSRKSRRRRLSLDVQIHRSLRLPRGLMISKSLVIQLRRRSRDKGTVAMLPTEVSCAKMLDAFAA